MSAFESLISGCLECIDFLLIIIIGIIHLVYYFRIKVPVSDDMFLIFESSPLFNFKIGTNCGDNSHIIFHVWKGRERTFYYNGNPITLIVEKTEIDKINGYQFCYNYISYKDLLYNGQIIKKSENCSGNYPKDCGIIDTLEQHLCIKNDEKCPLYDIRIGEPENKEFYTFQEGTNIYYNNDDYNVTNKKIIGNLILNDGIPCFSHNEKLWRKFVNEEAGEGHLMCETSFNGLTVDVRYKNQGDITYNELYYDNLSEESYNVVKAGIKGDEYVSLYKREFLGIDKECDEKSENKKENEKLRKFQKMEKYCLLVESILTLSFLVLAILISCWIACCCRGHYVDKFLIACLFFIIICYILMNLICIVCQSIFLGKIIEYNVSYDCSDEITNELFKHENDDVKENILYTSINLGLDIFFILLNGLSMLICFLIDKIKDKQKASSKKKEKINNDNNKNNYAKNNINADGINKDPIKEVIVNNGNLAISNQFNKPNDNNNKINNNVFNNPNTHPVLQTGVAPPPIEQGNTSNVNIL